jgi:hypothetical protein
MRIVVILAISVGTALAQDAASPDRAGSQQLAAFKAELTALKASEAANQAKLAELLKTRQDSDPDVVVLRKKVDLLRITELRAEVVIARLSPVLPERWWRDPTTARRVGVTADQQKEMDDVFQRYFLKLVDLDEALEREEITLEPLVGAQPLDEARITAQIDRVAQARAELEKGNGRMLLAIRKLLTQTQWSKLNQGFTLAPAQK